MLTSYTTPVGAIRTLVIKIQCIIVAAWNMTTSYNELSSLSGYDDGLQLVIHHGHMGYIPLHYFPRFADVIISSNHVTRESANYQGDIMGCDIHEMLFTTDNLARTS